MGSLLERGHGMMRRTQLYGEVEVLSCSVSGRTTTFVSLSKPQACSKSYPWQHLNAGRDSCVVLVRRQTINIARWVDWKGVTV